MEGEQYARGRGGVEDGGHADVLTWYMLMY
jgi:hypothetical protein